MGLVFRGSRYKQYQKWESGRSWKLGQTYIVFVKTEDRFLEIPYHRKRAGLNHLAFHARLHDHVDQVTERLKEQRVTILYADTHPYAGGKNHYAVYFEDPDRIKVELVASVNKADVVKSSSIGLRRELKRGK